MNIEALQQLRRVVGAVPDHRLHMGDYCHPYAECGTACCAIGWAATDEWFQVNTIIKSVFSVFNKEYDGKVLLFVRPEQPAKSILASIIQIFDISEDDAIKIFAFDAGILWGLDQHIVTKQMVIENIDRVLRGEPAIRYRDQVPEEHRRLTH